MSYIGTDTVAVIMAGGTGTRFWPLSTGDTPKQFLSLFGDKTLLNLTYDRIDGLIPPERVLVLTNERYTGLVARTLPNVPPGNIIGEPCRRDTAAALALATAIVRRRYGNPVMAVLTADHLIEPVESFRNTLAAAVNHARMDNVLYTFGIPPTFPSTAYGYLELGGTILNEDGLTHYTIRRFKEKPDMSTATGYVSSGRYLWNSGMFVWAADTMAEEFARFLPGHMAALDTALAADGAIISREALGNAFTPLPRVSVDYAVMEKSGRVRCIRAPFQWSDVGGWQSIEHLLATDQFRNAVRGEFHSRDAAGNIVFCEDETDRVVLIGVNDCIVVKAGRNLLVTAKERAEEIKEIVETDLSPEEPGGG